MESIEFRIVSSKIPMKNILKAYNKIWMQEVVDKSFIYILYVFLICLDTIISAVNER